MKSILYTISFFTFFVSNSFADINNIPTDIDSIQKVTNLTDDGDNILVCHDHDVFAGNIGEQIDLANLDSVILEIMNEYPISGVSGCIVIGDQVYWSGSYGLANRSQQIPVTDSTIFLVASISKLFTATALMQLWEKGLFNLNDNVNLYLPIDLRIINPAYQDNKISFYHLLTHTSSIDHDWGNIDRDLLSWGTDCPITLEDFLYNYFMPGGNYYYMNPFLSWAPGTNYSYSGPAYGLIGYLVEQISGTDFPKYCKDNIFNPLQMRETSWFLSDLDGAKLAIPYIGTKLDSGVSYVEYEQYGWPHYPAATLRTSASELAHFLIAFINHGKYQGITILDSTTVDKMTTIKFPEICNSGLGWNLYEMYEGEWYPYHTGSHHGFRTFIGYGKKEKIGVIVLTNSESNEGRDVLWQALLDYALPVNVDKNKMQYPKDYMLHQNYPNPFNLSTTIEFSLPKSEFVELKVYNLLGKEVSTLVSKKLNKGNHTYTFNGSKLASGIYYYQLVAGEYREVKKMVLIK